MSAYYLTMLDLVTKRNIKNEIYRGTQKITTTLSIAMKIEL
jgi:hypothetical protein